MRLTVDNVDFGIHSFQSAKLETLIVTIPPELYLGDHRVRLTIKKEGGPFATMASLKLYQFEKKPKGGGCQSTGLNSYNAGSRLTLYPNPVKDMATIIFQLKIASRTTISLYDITGREQRKVIAGMRNAGQNIIRFPVSDLPNGIYYLKLNLGDTTLFRKLTICK